MSFYIVVFITSRVGILRQIVVRLEAANSKNIDPCARVGNFSPNVSSVKATKAAGHAGGILTTRDARVGFIRQKRPD